MERPDKINGLEIIRALELMGLTMHYRSGPFCVFLNQAPGERVLFMVDGWDLPADDIEGTLRKNNLDVARFWECYNSFFRN